MKKLLFILMLLPTVSIAATPASIVFGYECEEINKKNLGFTCNGIEGDVQRFLQIHVMNTNLNKDKKINYEFNKFLLRYIDLGGKYITIKVNGWPENKTRECTATKNRKNFRCNDCVMSKDGIGTCK